MDAFQESSREMLASGSSHAASPDYLTSGPPGTTPQSPPLKPLERRASKQQAPRDPAVLDLPSDITLGELEQGKVPKEHLVPSSVLFPTAQHASQHRDGCWGSGGQQQARLSPRRGACRMQEGGGGDVLAAPEEPWRGRSSCMFPVWLRGATGWPLPTWPLRSAPLSAAIPRHPLLCSSVGSRGREQGTGIVFMGRQPEQPPALCNAAGI